MKILLFKILILCLAFFSNLAAQNKGYLQTISIPDGLSSPNVMNVYQDRFGYIWIMTEDGLNRYDGSKIKIYRNDPDDPNSLFNNSVFSAVEDKDGYLWIGGIGVVNKYDYATENFETLNLNSTSSSEKERFVNSLLTDSKGRIWAGTSGGTIHKLDRNLNSFEAMYYSNNENLKTVSAIWNIVELKNGKILLADYNFGIYQYNESSGKFHKYLLGDNFSPDKIFKIQEDDNGIIWFSGESRIIRYSPNFYSYDIIKDLVPQTPIYYLGYHKISEVNYAFVVEPFGLIHYNPKTSQLLETIRTELPPYWLISDKFDIAWIAANGGLIKYDPNREPFTYIRLNPGDNQNNRSKNIYDMSIDKSDRDIAWLLVSENKLVKYNLINNNFETYNIDLPDSISFIQLDRFVQDKRGNFIIGSTNSRGVFKFDKKSGQLTLLNKISGAFKFGFRSRDFVFDQNNTLFFASTSGLIYYNFSNDTQHILPTVANRRYNQKTEDIIDKALTNAKELAQIIEADETKSYEVEFEIDQDSYIFIRCLGEGRIDDRTGDLIWDYGVLNHSDGRLVFEMQDFSKTFHAGGGTKNRMQYETIKLTRGKYNLKYIMDQGHSFNNFNNPPPDDSTYYGIQVYKISEKDHDIIKRELTAELNNTSQLPLEFLSDVEISRKFSNSVYLSSDTQGLFRFNTLDSSYVQYTFGDLEKTDQKNWLQSSYEDLNGNLWISTAQGLVWLNPDNGKWRVFTEKDGLPSNNIIKTIEDNNGDLWIISLGGLSKFNKNDSAEKWNFVNYDTRDGLTGTGYSFNGDPVRTAEGEILFIVGDGIHRFKPGKTNPVKPDIIIKDLKISDISVFNSKSPVKLKNSLSETSNLQLPHHLNDLSFSFNIIHYSRPYKNRLFYKMRGFNQDWIESELGTATFTNLDPGSYEFKVRGISADGIRNDEGAALKIYISPPWWKTNFAYVGYFLIFVGLIISIDRIQRHRLLSKERAANAIKEAELRAQLAESENDRKTKELEEARALQLSMLPKELPQLPHLDIAVYMQTATEVGGDYYDFNVALDGTLTVVVGDATGHGMKAGTMVTTAKTLFKSYASNPDILFSFHEFTRCIKEMNYGKLSMCMTMLKIKGNKLEISTAGMPPSFIFRKDTKVVEEHLFKAMPLGTMEKFPYEIKDTTLKPGDTILLLSDGLPELKNEKNEMYGYRRIRNGFEDVAEKAPEEIVSYLKNVGAGWINHADPDDDVTFVVIKVK